MQKKRKHTMSRCRLPISEPDRQPWHSMYLMSRWRLDRKCEWTADYSTCLSSIIIIIIIIPNTAKFHAHKIDSSDNVDFEFQLRLFV